MHRLLDHDDAPPQLAQCGITLCLLPELAKRLEVLEILVAIQRDEAFSARSTRLTPKFASSGAMCRASAQPLCCRYNSRQKSKNETGAIRSASFAAWLMTSSISGRSCSKVVAGFFVNHFGGKPSALRPKEDFPATVTVVLANRCGTSVMLAMP